MTNPQKEKGTRAERLVADHLAYHWPDADRRVTRGRNDRGDIAGVPGVCIEIKSWADLARAVSEGLREAEKEAVPGELPLLVARRRNTAPGGWYAVTTLDNMIALIKPARP